jgi:DNA invertase Pin-like site-specific DNA recombinase
MKRAALYLRVSTLDQHPETQMYDLRALAGQRGHEIVREYTDRISGAKAKRPGLEQMMADARRGRFDVVLVWAFDRLARSVRHFLEVLDELNHLNIEFVSFRENIDTGGPLGRAMIIMVGAIAELERNLIIERVRAGMRRARLEGRHIGRQPIELDEIAIHQDRAAGHSLRQIAQAHRISTATVRKALAHPPRPCVKRKSCSQSCPMLISDPHPRDPDVAAPETLAKRPSEREEDVGNENSGRVQLHAPVE